MNKATDVVDVPHIENTPMLVEIAEALGIRRILLTDYRSTQAKLADLGLRNGARA